MRRGNQFIMGTIPDEQVMNDWIEEIRVKHRKIALENTKGGLIEDLFLGLLCLKELIFSRK